MKLAEFEDLAEAIRSVPPMMLPHDWIVIATKMAALGSIIEHLEAPADDAAGRVEICLCKYCGVKPLLNPDGKPYRVSIGEDGTVYFKHDGDHIIVPIDPAPAASVDLEAVKAKLEALAKLGNGDRYGNSEGNVLALEALAILSGGKL